MVKALSCWKQALGNINTAHKIGLRLEEIVERFTFG